VSELNGLARRLNLNGSAAFFDFGDLRRPQARRQKRVSGLSYPLALALTLRCDMKLLEQLFVMDTS
jgi:hypothetical protein